MSRWRLSDGTARLHVPSQRQPVEALDFGAPKNFGTQGTSVRALPSNHVSSSEQTESDRVAPLHAAVGMGALC